MTTGTAELAHLHEPGQVELEYSVAPSSPVVALAVVGLEAVCVCVRANVCVCV